MAVTKQFKEESIGKEKEKKHPSKRIRRARFLFSKTMEELSCIAQQYAWGKLGVDSEVARFKKGAVQYIFHLSLGLFPPMILSSFCPF